MFFFFFFNDTATTEIYTLSLHDALPISRALPFIFFGRIADRARLTGSDVSSVLALVIAHEVGHLLLDRKSTRLNSSHLVISYAVFCLKKKKYVSSYVVLHDHSQ